MQFFIVTEHIFKDFRPILHRFWSNIVYYMPLALIDLLCELGFLDQNWRNLPLANKKKHAYIHTCIHIYSTYIHTCNIQQIIVRFLLLLLSTHYYCYYYHYCNFFLHNTRASPHLARAPTTEHISNLHCFRSNKVYYLSHAIIDLLWECGIIWIKSDGAFFITNKHAHIRTCNIR